MKIRGTFLSLVIAAGVFVASSAAAQIVITVGDATAEAGGTATFEVTLSGVAAGGTLANNAQLDIIFPTAVFNVQAPASAICTLDPRLAALNHTESLPTSPDPGAGNQRLRLNIIDSLDPLGDVTDGVLYTCSFPVKADAPSGAVTLVATRQNVGDTVGNILASSTVDGTVTVEGGAAPCPDVTPVPTPESGIFIQVLADEQAAPGDVANFTVTLNGVAAGGTPANNAQLDIIFPTAVFDVQAPASAICTLDPRLAALNHTESLPTSPDPGAGNQRLRLNIIDSLDPLGDVTDGVLYTCAFPVKGDAPTGDVIALVATRQNVGDTVGNILASTTVNGAVAVCDIGGPTPVPTDVPTATPTQTVEPTVTNTAAEATSTPSVTNTVPATATRTSTVPSGLIEDEDGCQMTARSTANGWALLIPAIFLLGLRRRSR